MFHKYFEGVPVSGLLALPTGVKCKLLVACHIMTGAKTGKVEPLKLGAELSTMTAAPNADGDVVLFAADGPTLVRVAYLPVP